MRNLDFTTKVSTVKEIVDFMNSRGFQAEVFYCDGNGIVNPEKYESMSYGLSMINTKFDLLSSAEINDSDIRNIVYIGVQPTNNESKDVITKPTVFKGINKYMYINVNDAYTNMDTNCQVIIKVNRDMIYRFALNEMELWERATENTKTKIKIESFGGMPVITNKTKVLGASTILFDCYYEDLSNKVFHDEKLVVIPSSIHECIIMKYDMFDNPYEFTEMVKAVNQFEVDPREWLADYAYVINTNDWTAEAIESATETI